MCTSNNVKNPRAVAQNICVTHTGFDDMVITLTPIYLLKTQNNEAHQVGLVQLSYEFIVLTSVTSNNVENSRTGAPKWVTPSSIARTAIRST